MRPLLTPLARPLLTLAVCLSFTAPAAGVEAPDAAVGAGGEIYLVRAGSYGELFPEQGLAPAENPALALEIAYPDQRRERLLIPGAESEDVEDSASILFEGDSGTLFILWQTKINVIHSRLNLIGFRDGEWSEAIEISGKPFGWKSSPQLAVTRDAFNTPEPDGSLRAWQRTVAHLVWWEEGASGAPDVQYSPVVFLDGDYTGWNPVLRLADLGLASGIPLTEPNHALARAPRIELGVDGQSVVIAFATTSGTELVTVVLELLPGELAALADKVRAQIIEVGRSGGSDSPLRAIADKARAQIIEVGSRLKLHPGVSSYLAAQVFDGIVSSDPERPVIAIAEDVRAQIIEVGGQVTDRGFGRLSAKSSYQVIELPGGDRTDGAGATAPPDLIRLARASARAVPRTGEQAHQLHLSGDGTVVVATWTEGSYLLYRESRGQGWSEIRRLRLDRTVDLQRGHALLERRADELSASHGK